MEKKIDKIIEELSKHEINKHEAKSKLLVLFGVVSSSDAENEALNEAVSAIYFNDKSDYLRALYNIVRKLSGVNDLFIDKENIKLLFKELNPND